MKTIIDNPTAEDLRKAGKESSCFTARGKQYVKSSADAWRIIGKTGKPRMNIVVVTSAVLANRPDQVAELRSVISPHIDELIEQERAKIASSGMKSSPRA